jgi:hypothetical protein
VFLIGFPLLLIPFTIFNIIVFMMPTLRLDAVVGILPLTSGKALSLTLGDALILLSIFLLLIEMVKAARPGAKFAMDHILSLILFGCAAAELLLLPHEQFVSTAFLFLVALMFVDAIAGISISWRFRRYRRWATAEVQRARSVEIPSPVPAPAPAPAPAPVVQPTPPQPAPLQSGPPPAANEQTPS